MKFASLAAIGLVSSVEAAVDFKATTIWFVEGVKGYHEGFEKAFYKTSEGSTHADCLNDETVNNMATFLALYSNPAQVFKKITNIQEDFTMFADAAEIFENVSKCRFEGPALDIVHQCATQKDSCTLQKFLENLTKNMFVLVGKMTSIAETLKGFPAKTNDDFKEQMSELGDDAGTFARVTFNFHKD